MRLVYDLGIRIYYLGILSASLFNSKARKWIVGRRGLSRDSGSDAGTTVTWFHCSSLGEFEQGRPVIEEIRKKRPGTRILLTFYSPSGYEIRKNYPEAEYVRYLPLDTRRNARRFLDHWKVERAFFVKYEFWYHFLSQLHRRKIPVYLVSGIFRQNQVFFKWYGSWFRKILYRFEHLFVQQEASAELLRSIGLKQVSVSGDTRFDRVYEIARDVTTDKRFLSFRGDSRLIIAGSTWPADEEILVKYINETQNSCKWIIAPHEIQEAGITRIMQQINHPSQRFTRLGEDRLEDVHVLVVDTIGMLSSLYQYAHIAYIGGGFGRGIHNTLEAATFGNPVIFGPRYDKFQEARDLVARKAAFPVSGYPELTSVLDRLLGDLNLLRTSGQSAESYVKSMLGASSGIVDFALKRKTG